MSFSTRLKTWFFPEAVKRARAAELRGDLDGACTAYSEAGRYSDAVRTMLLRAEGELDVHRRALLLARATSVAPAGDPARAAAWKARARFILDRVEAGGVDPGIRRSELVEAGRALREIGEWELAARVLRTAGDLDGEIAALAEAGALGQLEEAVARQRGRDEARARRAMRFEHARDLIALGRRREAHDLLCAALVEDDADDVRALMQGLAARRPRLPASISIDGETLEVVPGNPVTLGRTQGELRVPAPVVSHRHLELARGEDGAPFVRDLGGKNGTTLRGARFDAMLVGARLDLLIGNALSLAVHPSPRGGLIVELPGRACWLPLGPIRFGSASATFASTGDGWLELEVPRGMPLILGDLQVEGSVQLLVGDQLFDGHGGPLLFRVVPFPTPERA